MIEHLFVTQADELIPALEAVAQSSDKPHVPMDRHIPAPPARSRTWMTAISGRFGGEGPACRRYHHHSQDLAGSRPCPAAQCTGFVHGSPNSPARRDAYANLKARKAAEASVERAVETGYLAELLKVVDDFKALERDENGYKRAMAEHQQCRAQILQLNLDLQNRENLASETGEQVAAVISGVVGSVGATAIVILYLF